MINSFFFPVLGVTIFVFYFIRIFARVILATVSRGGDADFVFMLAFSYALRGRKVTFR